MPTTALTGRDTITINNRILNDFADEVVAEITFPNDLVNLKTGKGGNTVYGFNASGRQCEMVLRILRGTPDDAFLNSILLSQNSNFSGFTLITGTMVKNIGDGAGNIRLDSYILSGGTIKRSVEIMESAAGDVNQAVAVWHLQFSNAPRAIG